MKFKILSRDEFRNSVFNRDNNKCVVCKSLAQDAHHIIERRLWPDGGYYIENGASLCGECHMEAEKTTISCGQLRELIGITKFPIPPHLYKDHDYDKWGNPILPNGSRLRGELFEDASVQKILSSVASLFTDKVKYPRTYHLPWSPGLNKDDRVMTDLKGFEDSEEVVVTVKMDGENTTLYNNYVHARSIDYNSHPSRSWVKALHSRIGFEIPEGWRICGENLFAKHSIGYSNLDDYFLMFSIWNDNNMCLSWEDTEEWAQLLGLKMVPVLYKGVWDEKVIKSLKTDIFNSDPCEGYVVRTKEAFAYKDFRNKVGKFVRKDHVQTHGHWMRSELVKNELGV